MLFPSMLRTSGDWFADFEQLYFIHFASHGAQDDDRRFHPSGAQLFANIHSAQSGHKQVHKDETGFHSQRLLDTYVAISGQNGLKALVLQHQSDSVPQAAIVVDYKHGLHVLNYRELYSQYRRRVVEKNIRRLDFTTLLHLGNVRQRGE